MENFVKIADYVKTMPEKKIIRKRYSPFAALVVLFAGICAIILGIKTNLGDVLNMTILVLGFVVAIIGLTCLLVAMDKNSGRLIYAPTKSKMKSKKVYVNLSDRQHLEEMLASGNFAGLQQIKKEVSTMLMLEILISKDDQAAVLQLNLYSMCSFSPVSEPVFVFGDQVAFVRNFLNAK